MSHPYIASAIVIATYISGFGHIPLSETVHGTVAISIWTPERIVLAADGKVTRRNDFMVSSYTRCKTPTVGRFFITAAGFYDRQRTGFHFWDLLAPAVEGAASVPAAADQIERAVSPGLHRGVADAKAMDLFGFIRDFPGDYLDFVVAGIDEGKTVVAGRFFSPDGRDGISVDKIGYPRPGPLDTGAVGFTLLGDHDEIDRRYRDSDLAVRARREPVSTAIQLIQIELDSSDKVGEPVSVVVIDKTSAHWERQGVCADIPKQQQPSAVNKRD